MSKSINKRVEQVKNEHIELLNMVKEKISENSDNFQNHTNEILATLEYDEENHLAKIEQRNYFEVGYEVQFFGPNMETFNYKINKIYNENKELIDVARHPKMIIYLEINNHLRAMDMMRLKVFDKKDFL